MSSERTVRLQGVDERKAAGMLHEEGARMETTAAAIAQAVPQFVDTELPEFRARYALIAGDIVIHFFLPAAVGDIRKADATTQRRWETYWLEYFPLLLDRVAKEHFRADKSRLAAKYTEELVSWWFRARGFGDSLNPQGLVELFYQKLAAELRAGQN